MPPGKRPDPTQPQTRTPLTKETPGSRRAATIVDLVRRELSADFSELSHALTLLKPQAVCESGGPSTDGEHYFYDPEWVIERARIEGYSCGAIRASMLHVVFHGLLGHFAEHVKYQRRNWVWDVMDLQVHEMMLEIGEGYYTDYTWDDREKLGGIHDYGLYYEACRSREIRREMKRRAKYIRLDDHRVWPVYYDRDRPMDGAPMSGAGAKARTQVIAMRWEEARELLLKAGGGMQDLMKNLSKMEQIVLSEQVVEHDASAVTSISSHGDSGVCYVRRCKIEILSEDILRLACQHEVHLLCLLVEDCDPHLVITVLKAFYNSL